MQIGNRVQPPRQRNKAATGGPHQDNREGEVLGARMEATRMIKSRTLMAVRNNPVDMEGWEKGHGMVVGMGQIDTVRKVVTVGIDTGLEGLNQRLGAQDMALGAMAV